MEIKVPAGTKILNSSHVSEYKYSSELIIPEGIEVISDWTFSNFFLQRITLPKSLKKIGKHAFWQCGYLEEVLCSEGLEEVGDDAFKDCYNLKYIFLPSTLKKIGDRAFELAYMRFEKTATGRYKVKNGSYVTHTFESKIERILLPKNVEQIGEHAFGWGSDYESSKERYCVCSESSSALECAKNARFTVIHADVSQGVIVGKPICDSTFYYFENSTSKYQIPADIKKIAPFAFYDCNDIKEVTIPKSVTEIGADAFRGCSSLERVAFEQESNLKTIAECAFGDCDRIKEIVIPKSVIEIGSYSFQRCVNLRRVTFEAISQLKAIAECAFCGCERMEVIIIPDSVTEIGANAFLGCVKLSTLTFFGKSKLQRICSKAFASFPGKIVDLPASVVEIADDAFPKGCIVSVDGEMPYYASRLSKLEEQKRTIDAKKKRVADLKVQLEEAKSRLEEHIASLPSKFDEISGLREEIRRIEESRDVERSFNNDERSYLNQRFFDVERKIRQLQAERRDCFFLAFRKKRELDEDIARRQSEFQSIRDDLQKLSNKSRDDEKRFADLIAPIQRKLDALLGEQKRWNDNKSHLTQIRDGIEKEIKVLSAEIVKLSAKLKTDEEALEREHAVWFDAKEKAIQTMESERQEAEERARRAKLEAEERERRARLEAEKKKLISEIGVPIYSEMISLFDCNYGREAIIEEKLLGEALRNMIRDFNDEKRAITQNQFVSANAIKIERIKTINTLLGLEVENGIAGYALLPVPELSNSYIPERVTILNDSFAKRDSWKRFKHSAVDIRTKKNTKANIHDRFFADLDCFSFKNDGSYLLVFPYFMVIYEPKKPLVVLSYDKAKLAVKFTDSEEIRDDIPAFGELIYERHKHLNADGSASRRYKDNPIIKTIRYTTVTIKSGYESFTFPTKTQDEAMQFENAFNTYRKVLTTGALGKVYSLVAESAEHQLIIEALDNLAEEEARLLELERQKKAEEQRRLEEERKAAEEAAAQKKREIIQRQRELNEARRREAEKAAEARKRVIRMFDDDFEADTADIAVEEADNATIPVEIIGNRLISNNVFKVRLKFVEEYRADSLIAYFVTGSGETISNKKKISVTTDDITMGFVLNSGIDYTTMQECLMRFESQGDILWNIDFKMNISFYSDF